MTKNESQFLGNYFPVCRMSMQKPSGVELLSHNPLRQIPAGDVMERCEVGAGQDWQKCRGGGGDTQMKQTGMHVGNFEFNP